MMLRGSVAWVAVVALTLTAGCGSSDGGTSPGGTAGAGGGTGGSGGAAGGSGGASTFDPQNPGLRMSFSIGVALLMGESKAFAGGAFTITGREDVAPAAQTPQVPMETCQVTTTEYTPSCTGQQDCAAEQQCVPETDANGSAIPNSNHCATPRTPLNVGPFTVTGFASGPKTLTYNSGQKGAYTTPGGDGSIDASELAFGTTYSFQGNGDSSQKLGAFTGQVRLGPQMQLTQPAMVTLPSGMSGIQASVSQDLVLAWSGSDPGAEVVITLTGASMSGAGATVTCRTADKGTFTIPAAMVQAAQLGDTAFFNMLNIQRTVAGTVSGDGLTSSEISTLQTALLNVAKQP